MHTQMMEKGYMYKATGWLGLLLGSRLWYAFHSTAVETDVTFMKQLDLVVREAARRAWEGQAAV